MGAADDNEGYITRGPWGSSHGKRWVYMPQGFIRKISVGLDGIVHSIKFQSVNTVGQTESSFFGGKDADRTAKICFEPDEYLISICGTTLCSSDNFGAVTSICFKTNKKIHGPYGTDSGTPFSFDGKGWAIIGFHGCTDKYLSSIGVYVIPESLAISTQEGRIIDELCSSMSRMIMPRDPGPWGVDGGKPWDDGVFYNVKQVRVYLGGANVLYALQFIYLKRDAKSVISPVRGETGASKIEVIDLDGMEEYLTGISGFHGYVAKHYGVTSISFHTNKKIHGPYGEKIGSEFTSYMTSPGKVVGFHGRSTDGFLTKIGIHMEYA